MKRSEKGVGVGREWKGVKREWEGKGSGRGKGVVRSEKGV